MYDRYYLHIFILNFYSISNFRFSMTNLFAPDELRNSVLVRFHTGPNSNSNQVSLPLKILKANGEFTILMNAIYINMLYAMRIR